MYFCKNSQPQPLGGKKRLILTISKIYGAGHPKHLSKGGQHRANSSSKIQCRNYLRVRASSGSKPQIRPLQSLVPAGSRPQMQSRPPQPGI
ncbi:hypothetical protein F2Q68_00010286 [Brassica cretica]|uniref:Uncharacterized protein n=1 Tax=Brassica cretica TaxID=69181 RepID=A0A8S9KWR7_BRACR|nr:hypothetical protein F2Q68_00010286 [Brassica cretica]